jgi:hypothetical protein
MDNIIQFPWNIKLSVNPKEEPLINSIDKDIERLLSKTPDRINDLINLSYTNPNEIIEITQNDFRNLIFDYIIFKLRSWNIDVYWSIVSSSSYITDLLFNIFLCKDRDIKDIINNPYYVHWMNQWFYKKAWDASVYSYLFKSFEGKAIKREEYINFAMSWYYTHTKDEEFSQSFWYVLPEIQWITRDEDFLKRWNLRLI